MKFLLLVFQFLLIICISAMDDDAALYSKETGLFEADVIIFYLDHTLEMVYVE